MKAPDPLELVARARAVAEATSNQWSTILVFASVAIALGVALSFAADLIELLEDIREKKPIRFHTRLMFFGTALIIAGVGFEFAAELNGAKAQTKIREDNAIAVRILADRAVTANAQAASLDQYVTASTARINGDIAALERADAQVRGGRSKTRSPD